MRRCAIARLVLGLTLVTLVVSFNDAKAQALFPHSYDMVCTGVDGGGAALSLVGDIQFTSPIAALGGAEFIKGSVIQFLSFTATFTNGTANAQGVGGNSIPKGCFTGKGTFSGDSWNVLNGFFDCYNETTHGFDLTQTNSTLGSGAALTCHAKEM